MFEPPTHGTCECDQLLRDKAITAEPAKLIKSLVSPPNQGGRPSRHARARSSELTFEIILSSVLCKYIHVPSGKKEVWSLIKLSSTLELKDGKRTRNAEREFTDS